MKSFPAALLILSASLNAAPPQQAAHKAIVGYFPQWGVYNKWFAGDLVHSGAINSLTQINYAQGGIKNNQCVIADPWADMEMPYTAANSVDSVADDEAAPGLKGNFHQLQKLRAKYPKLRILISLEGKAADFAAASQPDVRSAYVRSCIERFILGHLAPGVEAPGLFDGIDLDWEYPKKEDNANYLALLAEFRKQMDSTRPHLTLGIAVGAVREHADAVEWRRVAKNIDQIGVMTYDYFGPWSHTTGFVAPLRSADPTDESAETAIDHYIQAGVPRDKLLFGLPFYAYQWKDVGSTQNGFGQKGTPVRGNLSQHRAADLLAASPNAKLYRDPLSKAPWVYDGNNFLTFEDVVSLKEKAAFAARERLGGFMIWDLSGDADDASLVRALKAAR